MCVSLLNVETTNLYLYLRRFIIRFFCSFIYFIMLWVLISYAKKSVLRSVWSISYIFWEWHSRYFVHVSIMPFFGASKQKNRSSEHMIATPKFFNFWITNLGFWSFWMNVWRFCCSVWFYMKILYWYCFCSWYKKNNDEILVFENDKRTQSRFVTVNGQ